MSATPLLPLLIFIITLPIVAYIDIREQRIYNSFTFPLTALALIFGAVVGGIGGFTDHLWGAFIAGGVWFLLWHTGLMGGGDQKLMMMVGAWLGKESSVVLIFAVAILGGLQALIWIAARRLQSGDSLESHDLWRKTKLPYSVAIAVAALGIAIINQYSLWPPWALEIIHQFI